MRILFVMALWVGAGLLISGVVASALMPDPQSASRNQPQPQQAMLP